MIHKLTNMGSSCLSVSDTDKRHVINQQYSRKWYQATSLLDYCRKDATIIQSQSQVRKDWFDLQVWICALTLLSEWFPSTLRILGGVCGSGLVLDQHLL